MFHNVLMTTLAPIRDTNEMPSWNNRPFTTIWPEVKQDKLKETSIKKTIRKKKRNRTMFTTEQVRVLEKIFARTKYIDVERRREISECLQIEQKCIKIWFQNRRMKEKKELSESCDSNSESQVLSVESLSSPLESPQPSNNECDTDYKPPHVCGYAKPLQYYYDDQNYHKTEIHQNEPINYETSNHPEYINYNTDHFNSNVMKNNSDYSTQYYSPQTEYQYYLNTGEINNQYLTSNIRDWPANIFGTSYF